MYAHTLLHSLVRNHEPHTIKMFSNEPPHDIAPHPAMNPPT